MAVSSTPEFVINYQQVIGHVENTGNAVKNLFANLHLFIVAAAWQIGEKVVY